MPSGPEGYHIPPRDSLITPTHSTGEPSPVRSVQEREQGISTSGNWKPREQGVRPIPRSPLSPDRRSQREERDSVLDAVRQITGASKEIPRQEKVSFDTPEYDWDTRYDGIQDFPSCLKNRVSEPSTPQRGQSPKGGPRTPPESQRYYKQLKVYDETPSGRPLPTLQQIRQANLRKIFEEEGVDTPCDICGDPQHDYRNCTREGYLESQDVRQDPGVGGNFKEQCPNCDVPHPGVCPCAWCEQPNHIAQDCMAHFADTSMQTRFPKREKVKKSLIKQYDC